MKFAIINRFLPGIVLGGFLLWLMTFPMEVILPGMDRNPKLFHNFLLAHGITLLLLAFYLSARLLGKTMLPALGITIGATLTFPYLTEHQNILLIVAGSSSAWLMIKAGVMLKNSSTPFLNSAIGLALGNILLLISAVLPIGDVHYLLIAMFILPLAIGSGARSKDNGKSTIKFLRYLPVIFIFYLVSGQMYGYLDVLYTGAAVMPGLEVSFYVSDVIAGGLLIRINPPAALAFSIALSMLSLSFLQSMEPVHINTSMYLKQASKGFFDIFVFYVMLSHSRPIFAFGLTSGLVCLSLSLGTIISILLSDLVLHTVVIGNIALAATMIIFFYVHNFQVRETPEPSMLAPKELNKLTIQNSGNIQEVWKEQAKTLEQVAPRPLLGRLSGREKEVLEMVLLQQMMFKEAAEKIGITESSVKTYMRRIYEKAGVKDKTGLREIILNKKKP